MTPASANTPDPTLHSAERLRAEFDRSFTEPARDANRTARDFVLVLASGMQWALALSGLHGIEHDRPLVPMPSSHAALLGMAGVGSMVIPVFDLAALAQPGHIPSQPKAARRSIFALLQLEAEPGGTAQRVGVAFERLLQFARVAAESILRASGSGSGVRSGSARPTLEHEHELYILLEPEDLLSAMLNQPRAGASSASPSVPIDFTEAAPRPPEHAPTGDATK